MCSKGKFSFFRVVKVLLGIIGIIVIVIINFFFTNPEVINLVTAGGLNWHNLNKIEIRYGRSSYHIIKVEEHPLLVKHLIRGIVKQPYWNTINPREGIGGWNVIIFHFRNRKEVKVGENRNFEAGPLSKEFRETIEEIVSKQIGIVAENAYEKYW